jgi:ubiquinone biosynthesis protein UbiJ
MAAEPAAGLFRPLELLLNEGIRASTDAAARCRALDGRSFRLQFDGLKLGVTFASRGDRLELGDAPEADATLSGPPLSLARLAATGDEDVLRSRVARITGDPLVAQDFRDLIRLATPDFEEALARVVGDLAARRVANLARGFAAWGLDSADRLSRDLADFLKEERRDLPARPEVEAWLDGVDAVSDAVSRAEARLARLELRRARAKGTG